MELIFSLTDIQAAASQAWKQATNRKVLAFHGEMGSGKTTFIRAMCAVKNIPDVVSSPTFSIINEYRGSEGTIFHMDLYRLNSVEEAMQAGVEDCLYSGNICLVEWPEKAPSLLPDDAVNIRIDVVDEQTRRLRIED